MLLISTNQTPRMWFWSSFTDWAIKGVFTIPGWTAFTVTPLSTKTINHKIATVPLKVMLPFSFSAKILVTAAIANFALQ